jgi:CRP/FNR family transcriptional regulator, cyclic AMP receptor protein
MFISKYDLFGGISSRVMKEITDICVEEVYDKGTTIFNQGERAENLYILREGTLNLMVKNGGSLVFSLSEQGEVFGWSSLFESGRYTASGICDTDLKVFKIERKELYKILKHNAGDGFIIMRRLAGVIANRLNRAYQDILSTTY